MLIRRSFFVLTILLLLLSATAPTWAATASIALSGTTGPPTAPIRVYRGNFGAGELVDISFDSTLLATAVASANGRFRKGIQVPASALPGNYTVTATGQTSGQSASATFRVHTNWPEYQRDAGHTGFNPYENIVDVSTVSSLSEIWGTTSFTSRVVMNGVLYASSSTEMSAFDLLTGAMLWTAPLSSGSLEWRQVGACSSCRSVTGRSRRSVWRRGPWIGRRTSESAGA